MSDAPPRSGHALAASTVRGTELLAGATLTWSRICLLRVDPMKSELCLAPRGWLEPPGHVDTGRDAPLGERQPSEAAEVAAAEIAAAQIAQVAAAEVPAELPASGVALRGVGIVR